MRFRHLLTALALSFSLLCPAWAQDTAAPADPVDAFEDIENAGTPRDLLKLLPEDEADWPEPFWLNLEAGMRGGGDSEQIYMGWSIQRTSETIVLSFHHGQENRHAKNALVYNVKGELQSMSMREDSPHRTRVTTAALAGDHLKAVSVTTYHREGAQAPRRSESAIPIVQFKRAIPLEWLPLVVSDHARRGSLGYQLSVFFLQQSDDLLRVEVEDVGSERVEVDGKPRKARLLRVSAWEDRDRPVEADEKVTMLATFLETGEFVNITAKHEQFQAKGKRVSREELVKAFDLPEEGGDADAGGAPAE